MSELTVLRQVLVVREDGRHLTVGLLAEPDPAAGTTVVDYPGHGWHAVPSWTVVDPPYEMTVDRADILDGRLELARDDARRMSALDTTVLDAYNTAGADGLTNDALDARLEQAGVAEFDRSIAPKIRAAHLERGWIEVLPSPERSRRQRREPAHVRRITGPGRLVHVERRLALATAVPS